MLASRMLFAACAVLLACWGVSAALSPYRANLSSASADATAIARLPKEEKELVLAYLRRSREAKSADPASPLTARTLGDAIALERGYWKRRGEELERIRALRVKRHEALAPLLDAVSIAVVGREMRSRRLAPSEDASAALGQDDAPVLVTTYRVGNTSTRTITELFATVSILESKSAGSEPAVLTACRFARSAPIAPGQQVELSCFRRRNLGRESVFLAMRRDEFVVDWVPRLIRFDDGSSLIFTE
ncbi:hypothetical protein [Niveibacterium terrae]|uniref:hypothetical protein n=1 Tax=Niveibacterium terrae TaxID=3373598 RepID=UPI003A8E4696